MKGQNRKDICPGALVDIILKKDQRNGNVTRGIVKDILTSSAFHSRGIKVRLDDGQVGRVVDIIDEDF
ncbi:MAG TPA: YwbE family protein [Sphingobacteriaceae bacterium]